MARLILPFLVAFLVAVAGSSAAMLVRARDAHNEALVKMMAAKAKADSAGKPVAPGDHPDVEPTSPTPTAAADAAHAEAPPPMPVSVPTTAPAVASHAPAPTQTAIAPVPTHAPETAKPDPSKAMPAEPAGPGASERRLAKIFSSMSPKDAAKVLVNMEDGDVKVILGYLGNRQAAAILGSFPPARAAELSRLALKGAPPASGAKD
jgi:hypothetical protein